MESYSSAGSVSEEAIMAIRTVVSLGLEKCMAEKYRSKLRDAERAALRACVWVALGEIWYLCLWLACVSHVE